MNQAGQKENAFHAEGTASGKSLKGKAAAASVFPGGESSPSASWSTVVSRTPLGEEDCFFKEAFLDYFELPKRNCILDIISWFCGRTWK